MAGRQEEYPQKQNITKRMFGKNIFVPFCYFLFNPHAVSLANSLRGSFLALQSLKKYTSNNF